jgi:hypothetical protein
MLPFLRDEKQYMDEIIVSMENMIDENKAIADEIRCTIQDLEEFVKTFKTKEVKNDN